MSFEKMSFEERHTAWVDGAMDESGCAAFERELPDLAGANRERNGWLALRERVRAEVPTAALAHGDFLNSQVLAEIERDRKVDRRAPDRGGLFPIARLWWAGSSLAALAVVLTTVWMVSDHSGAGDVQFATRVIEAQMQDPMAEAYVFQAPGGRGSVLWLEGAGYIPPTERL